MIPAKLLPRLARDLKELSAPAEGIFAKVLNDNLSCIYMMLIGPKGSPYEGCPFFFTIDPTTQFTPASDGMSYPFNPPKVLHYSPYSIRVHPNLYTPSGGGKVCLSILGTWSGPGWTSIMTFSVIAHSILMILNDEPLRCEPGFERGHDEQVRNYTNYVQYVCSREAIERVFLPVLNKAPSPEYGVAGYGGKAPPQVPFLKIFGEELTAWFLEHREEYVTRLEKLHKRFLGKKIDHPVTYGDNCYVGSKFNFDELAERVRKGS
jgi:ubiquitin-protein ligase